MTTSLRAAAAAVVLGAVEGHSLSSEEARFLSLNPLAGITLFKRNVAPSFASQLIALNNELRRLTGKTAIIAIDQEGGRVSRLPQPFPNLGPAATLFAAASSESERCVQIEQYGFVVGATLRGLGINTNFAPVADIMAVSGHQSIGDRAFGDSAELVISRAGAFISGQTQAQIGSCLKHFPGQGAATADTHHGGTVIHASRDALEAHELRPFRALHGRVGMVMVAHAIYPALDAREATLSAAIMQDLLRTELGFQGLILSDDMNMGAIQQDDATWTAALESSLVAGADLLLICRHLERQELAVDRLTIAAERSAAFANILSARAERVRRYRLAL